MPSLPTLFFMAIFFLESLVAMLQNGIMAAVLGWEGVQGQALPKGDMIVACLSASRFSLHGITFMNNFLVILNFGHRVHYLDILWDFSNTLSFWLNALLSVFYCVKIASFSHPTFLWLRWRISCSVPRLLLGSLAISVLTTIPSATGNTIVTLMQVSQPLHTNGSWADWARILYGNLFLFHEMLALSPPFLLFLASTALLMFSLRRHLHQMQSGRPRPGNPSTQAHIMALKSLGFFLVFYTSYFLSVLVAVMKFMPLQCHWYFAWQVVTYAGVSLHSTILLFSSPRLRRAFKNGLQGFGTKGCGGLDRGQVPPEGSDKEPVRG
ncbi:taste receptor type 2 member 134-like [Trichechus manatus latirostris]|uniref:Taste receptor type 2 n=1 Tax=Trichechus manatus latirostris TaxID=127582 RepID=A0A2Y9DXM7_TRIMA|nr:taste receptor type 2 member 134-like [Trichechus manatus latirostris]